MALVSTARLLVLLWRLRVWMFSRELLLETWQTAWSVTLSYAFRVVMSLVQSRNYRSQLLRTLVRLYRALSTLDYVQMFQLLLFLDEPFYVADLLEKLSADALMAYASVTQQFLSRVLAAIRKTAPAVTTKDAATTEESMDTEGEKVEAKEEAQKKCSS